MSGTDWRHLVANIVGHGSNNVSENIQLRFIAYWASVDAELDARVAAGLRLDTDTDGYLETAKLVESRSNRA